VAHPLRLICLCALGFGLGATARPTPAEVAVTPAELQAATPRERLLFDTGWRFALGSAESAEDDFGFGLRASFSKAGGGGGAAKLDFDDKSWRTVTLPHDWAVELPFVEVKNEDVRSHGYKPIGRMFPRTTVGWYRRAFLVPESDKDKRLVLQFDGVMRDSIVWLNGHYLGRNSSGYGSFRFDVSDYLRYGQKNVVALRIDTSQYEGWFYEGAGIYRHAWLVKYAPLHVALDGTYVTSKVEPGRARLQLETRLANDGDASTRAVLTSVVLDPSGAVVASASSEAVAVAPRGDARLQQTIDLPQPQLWSLERPQLYRLISLVKEAETLVDRSETTFGIRSIRFDPNTGFYLNEKPVRIKGVCCHQDHAGVGAALPDRLQAFRIERLKEMGANAYRTSHHPPTPELLEACDRLGMLVMDENRLMGSTPEMQSQLEQLIRRDRNHPSVILWSLGNEEWAIQNTATGAAIARSLNHLQHELDPSRPSTYAGDNGEHWEGINSVVDVRGVNYIGRGDIDKYHRDHPEQPVVGSEEASTFCTRGIYAKDEAAGFVTDYDADAPNYGAVAERWWKFAAARPWLAGAFVWTGFDYRGEPSPYSWPCISSHFGILDTCGFPKNNFFYYQSWWSDADVLHLAPHWNWKGKEGQPIKVRCDSNAESVELLLNGRSLGRKPVEANAHLDWTVPYQPGVLEARGVRRGRPLSAKVETSGEPAAIVLKPDRTALDADGEDVAVVSVSVVDRKGRDVPDADTLVRFDAEGGAILGLGNGNPSSHESDKCTEAGCQRRLFSGRAQVIVQSSRHATPIRLSAAADGLKPAAVTIEARTVPLRPSVPE
jgi:beta-galactosidase